MARRRGPKRGRTYRGGRRGKKYQRKRKMNHPTMNRQRTIGFADKQMVKLRQCFDAGSLTGATAATYYITPTLLSAPLINGFSNSNVPNTYGQWRALYSAYVVKAFSVKFRIVADTGASATVVTVYPTSVAPSSLVAADILAAQPYAKQRLCGAYNGGHDVVNIKQYMSTQKILGYDYLDLALLGGSTSGSTPPQQHWYMVLNLQSLDGVTDLDHLIWMDMTFYVEYYDRLDTVN